MKRELIVTTTGADGREHVVVVDAAGATGQLSVTVDGAPHEVDARQIRPGTWSLLIAGRAFVVDLDPRRGAIAASVGASELTLTVEDARHRKLAQAAAAGRGAPARGDTIRAPIAGKVVKLLVELGQQVAPGTPVIVLEAMKMENELISERGGTVSAIAKQAGQAVDTGDMLIELT